MPGAIDLHCHTTASDGVCAPQDLVRFALRDELAAIAVTDHDTIGGVAAACDAAAGSTLEVVPGIELSTRTDGRPVHLLGYFVDTGSSELVAALEAMRLRRRDRAAEMVERLRELGYGIEFSDVLAQAGGDVIGRPHVARALVARGLVPTIRDAFTEGLIGDGGRAYVSSHEVATADAVGLVRRAGGVAVVAHPGVSHHEGREAPLPVELIAALVGSGLAGLEVDHPDHSASMRARLRGIASDLDLIPTGGSDWHGLPEHALGTCTTSPESYEKLSALAVREA